MTAYDMRISDWSSDVCSSDLVDQPNYIHLTISLKTLNDRLPDVTSFSDNPVLLVINLNFANPVVIVQIKQTHIVIEECGLIASDTDIQRIHLLILQRSEERSVGKECGQTFSYRWQA